MTMDSGHPVTGSRDAEIAEYVEAVREALADLPLSRRDDLLEDLPAHLAEVAAEDPTPLRERLGGPARYAAELRAAAEPFAGERRPTIPAWAAAQWQRVLGGWRRADVRAGRWLGYGRLSEFGRLLVPAWWVLRGYLAAMIVVRVLDDRVEGPGLLPRLGGSTIAGLVILAAFVTGSIWLAHREPRLTRWPRRAVLAGTLLVLLIGAVGIVNMDQQQRGSNRFGTVVTQEDPFQGVMDVFPVDGDGRLLSGVRLLDQDGRPIDIGSLWCGDFEYDSRGMLTVTYPRCTDRLPWWMLDGGRTTPSPSPSPSPFPQSPPPPPLSPSPDQSGPPATPGG